MNSLVACLSVLFLNSEVHKIDITFTLQLIQCLNNRYGASVYTMHELILAAKIAMIHDCTNSWIQEPYHEATTDIYLVYLLRVLFTSLPVDKNKSLRMAEYGM